MLSARARVVYAACAAGEVRRRNELTDRLSLGPAEAESAIAELRDWGLIQQDDAGGLHAAAPGPVLRSAADEFEQRAEQTRALRAELDRVWRETQQPHDHITVVRSGPAVAQLVAQVTDAKSSVDALEVGPVQANGFEPPPPDSEPSPGFLAAAARGVRFRVVYGSAILNQESVLNVVRACVRAGEQARVHPHVPFNLILVDDSRGVLIHPGTVGERLHALLVESSGLLDALRGLFDIYWQMSVPLQDNDTGAHEQVDDVHRQIVSYLLAGLTDAAIARDLGISERTVRRRIEALQYRTGARTRFQLGVYAARQGWLD